VEPDGDAEAFEATIDSFLAFYAPDVVCYPAPGWVQEEVCHGHDGLRRLGAVWSASFSDVALEIHDVRDLQERLLILGQLSGRDRSSGMPSGQRFGAVNSRLGADGKVGEVRFFLSWSEALDAVGLSS
jgi:SnoaL-like domain